MPWKLNRNILRPTISTQVAADSSTSHQPMARTSWSTSHRIGRRYACIDTLLVDAVAPRLADRGVPVLGALRVDLVAGVLPERQHHRGYGGLQLLLVGSRKLHRLHLESRMVLAGLSAGVAV